MRKKIYKTFDEWLVNRIGMTEKEFRTELEKNAAYLHYRDEYPDAVIECYKRKRREEMDIIASEGIDLTFSEWLKIYKHHTPETFHLMCDGTGASPADESKWYSELYRQWQERHDLLISGSCPF